MDETVWMHITVLECILKVIEGLWTTIFLLVDIQKNKIAKYGRQVHPIWNILLRLRRVVIIRYQILVLVFVHLGSLSNLQWI